MEAHHCTEIAISIDRHQFGGYTKWAESTEVRVNESKMADIVSSGIGRLAHFFIYIYATKLLAHLLYSLQYDNLRFYIVVYAQRHGPYI